jgi:hypothetical protein
MCHQNRRDTLGHCLGMIFNQFNEIHIAAYVIVNSEAVTSIVKVSPLASVMLEP